MTLDNYGHLFEDRLDGVGDAMDRASAARERRRERAPVPAVAQCFPSGFPTNIPQRLRSAFPLIRAAVRSGTPYRIRTGATAVKGRGPGPLDEGGLPGHPRGLRPGPPKRGRTSGFGSRFGTSRSLPVMFHLAWAGSSVGTSDRLKSDRSAVRPRPCPQATTGFDLQLWVGAGCHSGSSLSAHPAFPARASADLRKDGGL